MIPSYRSKCEVCYRAFRSASGLKLHQSLSKNVACRRIYLRKARNQIQASKILAKYRVQANKEQRAVVNNQEKCATSYQPSYFVPHPKGKPFSPDLKQCIGEWQTFNPEPIYKILMVICHTSYYRKKGEVS